MDFVRSVIAGWSAADKSWLFWLRMVVVQEAKVSFGITRCTMQVCCFHPNAMLGVDHNIIIFIRCMYIDAKAKAGAGGREGADSRHGKTGRGGRQTHTVIVFCRLYTTGQTKKKKN
jgi:hypothetical protein